MCYHRKRRTTREKMKLLQYQSLSWPHSQYQTVFFPRAKRLLGRCVTHHVRGACAIGVTGAVRGRPVGVVVAVAVLPAPLPLVYHQVDGHLALQAGDVPVAKVVA